MPSATPPHARPIGLYAALTATIGLVVLINYHRWGQSSTDTPVSVRAHATAVSGPRIRASAAAARAAMRWAVPNPLGRQRETPGSGAENTPRQTPPAVTTKPAPVQAVAAVVAAASAETPASKQAAGVQPCKEWCGSFWRTWCEAVQDCDVPFGPAVVQGMIEGGFSASASIRALKATAALKLADVPKAIRWAIEQGGKERGLAEFAQERDVRIFNHTDFDGYALKWGDKHRAASSAECGEKCRAWVPVPPTWFPCNIFVFCGKPKCFAPAALPPGEMTGQCWLKHQDEPSKPQYNMKGRYTDAYRRTHPTAPEWVDWDAGVVVPKGVEVRLDTPSARANWR